MVEKKDAQGSSRRHALCGMSRTATAEDVPQFFLIAQPLSLPAAKNYFMNVLLMIRRAFIMALAFFPLASFGFIPPLGYLLRNAFQGRKAVPNLELVLHHHVQLGSSTLDLNEQILSTRSQTLFSWRASDSAAPFEASLDRTGYRTPQSRMPLHSNLFLKYFTLSSPEPFRDALLKEEFIQSDDLLEYKAGFNPTGDPQTWDVKDNYLIHPDIYLVRLSDSVGVAVSGLDTEQAKHTIVFDRNEPGILRLEWKEGAKLSAWNFEPSVKQQGGWFPRRFSFSQGQSEVIQSELVSRRALSDGQAAVWKRGWQRAFSSGSLSPQGEEALQILLSQR